MYDTWDLAIPLMPQHSYLYQLEVIGIGTPYSESLASYINRLAIAHSVSPKTLITQEILARLGKLDQLENRGVAYLHHLWSQNAPLLNGAGWWARDCVQVLETLTQFRGLRSLTMLTWSDVISQRMMLRRTQAWCPKCYDEWRGSNQIIYNPLIWSIQSVEICLHHHQNLQVICPHENCQHSVPFLASKSQPGYCPFCQGWLGNTFNRDINHKGLTKAEELKSLYWNAEVIGDLIAKAPRVLVPPTKEDITLAVKRFSELITQGSISSLAPKLGISFGTIWHWQIGSETPQLAPLLEICSKLEISLYDFFMIKDIPLISIHSPEKSTSLSTVVNSYKRRKHDELQCLLEKVLLDDEEPPPSLAEVIMRLGYGNNADRYVSRKFPNLCHKITQRYRQWLKRSERDRVKQHEHLKAECLRKILEDYLASELEPPPSVHDISKQLGYRSKGYLHRCFPELCNAIAAKYAKYQEQLHTKALHALEEALKMDYQIPSVTEITQALGYPRNFLAVHFPDICRTITKKRREQLNNYRFQILENIANNNAFPPLSLIEAAKLAGCSTDCLKRNFPDLCSLIINRYHEYIIARKLERRQKIINEIRQTTFHLHAQGIYPGLRKVKNLSNLSNMREPFADCAWHEALQELGLEKHE